MDIMAFDGVRARVDGPVGLRVEAYGGLWVKGASFLASSVYQPDGTRSTDARRLAEAVPGADAALDDLEPLYGARLGWHGRLSSVIAGYRKALVSGKTDFERVSLEGRSRLGESLDLLGGAEYDLFLPRLSQVRVQAVHTQTDYALAAEAMRLTPVLSADSIWYYFATAPRDEVRLRGDLTPPGAFRYYAQAVASLYWTALNPDLQLSQAIPLSTLSGGHSLGGSAGAAYRLGRNRAALDVMYRVGFGGRQIWVDLTGGRDLWVGKLALDGRVSLASIRDSLNPALNGLFGSAQVFGSFHLAPGARLSLAIEENINSFTRSETKLFFLFDWGARL
jgi:hypothetical protein